MLDLPGAEVLTILQIRNSFLFCKNRQATPGGERVSCNLAWLLDNIEWLVG